MLVSKNSGLHTRARVGPYSLGGDTYLCGVTIVSGMYHGYLTIFVGSPPA